MNKNSYEVKFPHDNGKYKVYRHYIPQTGKTYIGMTKTSLPRRFQRGLTYAKNKEFYADIQKYGWDSVQSDVLYETDDIKYARIVASDAIRIKDTTNPERGYNLWEVTEKSKKPSNRVKTNISKSKMNHFVSPETRKKISEHHKRKAVVQLSVDGEFIRLFESESEAAKELNTSPSNIQSVCAGRRNTCAGYRWMDADEYKNMKEEEEGEKEKIDYSSLFQFQFQSFRKRGIAYDEHGYSMGRCIGDDHRREDFR